MVGYPLGWVKGYNVGNNNYYQNKSGFLSNNFVSNTSTPTASKLSFTNEQISRLMSLIEDKPVSSNV